MPPLSDSSPISAFLDQIGCSGGQVADTLAGQRFSDVGSLRVYVSLLGGDPEARMAKLQANLGLAPADAAKILMHLIKTGLRSGS